MSNQKPANKCIRVGSIFVLRLNGECGSSSCCYQVVGLRGKTLVELRKIQTREYVDGRCVKGKEEQRRFMAENPGEECTPTVWDWLVWSRPLSGQFDGGAFTVRALEPSEYDGQNCLQGRGEDSWLYYREVGEDHESMITGHDGGYARIALKKEGRLPSWAEIPRP